MSSDADAQVIGLLPSVFRGKEGRLNGHIIRYLALNGPSLIYAVSKYLSETSETRIHYPTVNRRMHDLLNQNYLQKAGTKGTKAGVSADLYATTIRGDFAACAGLMPENNKDQEAELSPNQIRKIIGFASKRDGSPFVLLQHLLEEGESGRDLVDNVIIPELAKSVRNGYLNLEATEDPIICSAFASVVARKLIETISAPGKRLPLIISKEGKQFVRILLECIDRVLAESDKSGKDPHDSHLTPVSIQWAKELRVFLRLSAIRLE